MKIHSLTALANQPTDASRPSNNPKTRPSVTERALTYLNKQTVGERVDKTEWHRIVTFQDGLITMFEKHARKGRLVYIDGKLQTRRWSKPGEDGDRFSTEILLVPGGRVQFLDKPNGNGASQPAAAPASGAAMPAGTTSGPADDFDDEIPF